MVGVDEVGRGCWAGPLLVVASREVDTLPSGVTDSKLLTKTQRIEILNLLSKCCKFGEGWIMAAEIDEKGLAQAMREGVKKALEALDVTNNEEIIMDGSVNYIPRKYLNTNCIIGADLSVPIVSAASIYAKVKRDRFMAELGHNYPGYGFSSHVGYGTSMHKEALLKFGVLPQIHRLSFKPVKAIVDSAV